MVDSLNLLKSDSVCLRNDHAQKVNFKSNSKNNLERTPDSDKVEKEKGLSKKAKIAIGAAAAIALAAVVTYSLKGRNSKNVINNKPSSSKPDVKPTSTKPKTSKPTTPKTEPKTNELANKADETATAIKEKVKPTEPKISTSVLQPQTVLVKEKDVTHRQGTEAWLAAAAAAAAAATTATTVTPGKANQDSQKIESETLKRTSEVDIDEDAVILDNKVLINPEVTMHDDAVIAEKRKEEERLNDEMMMAATLASLESMNVANRENIRAKDDFLNNTENEMNGGIQQNSLEDQYTGSLDDDPLTNSYAETTYDDPYTSSYEDPYSSMSNDHYNDSFGGTDDNLFDDHFGGDDFMGGLF